MGDETQVIDAPAPAQAAAPVDKSKPDEATLTRLFGEENNNEITPEGVKSEDKAEPAKEPKAAKAEQPTEEEAPQDDELDSIVQGLITAGVPAAVIKNASRADLIKWGQKQTKREADITLAFQERADLKRKFDELSKKATEKPEPSSGVPTGHPDLSPTVKAIAEAFGMSDLEKPLASFGDAILAKAVEMIEAKYADRIGALSVGSTAGEEMLLDSIRAQLTESFPGLSDDTKFAKAVEKANLIAATGAHAELPTARARGLARLEDACGMVFRNDDKAARQRKESSETKDAGQPVLRGTRSPPKKALTVEERAWRKFSARESGATDDEVARIG